MIDKVEESCMINFLESGPATDRSSISLNGRYVYCQLLLDGLIKMEPKPEEKEKLIAICQRQYKGNKIELECLERFKTEYKAEDAISWYTKESFVYRMLNKALRVQNIELLTLFKFFIRDLYSEIEKRRCKEPARLYRVQSMSNEELQGLTHANGKLVSMNSFVSTSMDLNKALKFRQSGSNLPQVMFQIDANPKIEGIKPFANVSSVSEFAKEREVLIMLGSVFRVMEVREDKNKTRGPMWIVRMTLCSDNEHDCKVIFEVMRNDIFGNGKEHTKVGFGQLLCKMGKHDEADQYFKKLLDEIDHNHLDYAECYFYLGNLASERGHTNSSLEMHEQALKQKRRLLPANHPNIALSYNSIGNVHDKSGNHQKALQSYSEALTIYKKAYGEQHPDVAMCLNNIGISLQKSGKNSEALKYLLDALKMRQRCLVPEHLDVATSYNNLGIVYREIGMFDESLENFQLSLDIKTKSLPENHPSITASYENIAATYKKKGKNSQALNYYEKAAHGYKFAYGSKHAKYLDVEKKIESLKPAKERH